MLSRFTGFHDLDGTFAALDGLRRSLEWGGRGARGFAEAERPATRLEVTEDAEGVRVEVDLPGLTESDVAVGLHEDVLTLTAERKLRAPEGYTPLREERVAYKFSRSFALPAKVDAEKVTATMKDGVLSVFLPRLPEAKPRTIVVRAVGVEKRS